MKNIDQKYLINYNSSVLEDSIYRIFKIEHLLEWFKTGKVAFCRPDEWEDPWEARLFKKSFRLNHNNLGVLPFMKLFYAQCWTRHEKESDLIWKLYSPNRTGVRVKTKINQFYDYLIKSNEFVNFEHIYHNPEFFLGKVKYYQEREIKRVTKLIKGHFRNSKTIVNRKKRLDKSIVNILFKKRIAFHHEKEFRFVYCTNNLSYKSLHSNTSKLFHFTINPLDIIDEILFDPRMDEKTFEEHRRTLWAYKFINPIKQSTLYKI